MLKIREFEDDDLQLLDKWLNKKYIKKWFEVPDICTIDDWLYEVKNRKGEFKWLSYFIVQSGDCPVGFCTYYKCVEAKEDWYGNISLDGVYSMDYLIGEEEYLGKGLGKEMIAKLVEMIFDHEDAKRIIVQPDKDNKASSSVLVSNGFILGDNIYGIARERFMGKLSKLPNIGLEIEHQLSEVGINTFDELKAIGAEQAWLKIQTIDSSACIHRLLALEGALQCVKKTMLSPERKAELKEFYEGNKK